MNPTIQLIAFNNNIYQKLDNCCMVNTELPTCRNNGESLNLSCYYLTKEEKKQLKFNCDFTNSKEIEVSKVAEIDQFNLFMSKYEHRTENCYFLHEKDIKFFLSFKNVTYLLINRGKLSLLNSDKTTVFTSYYAKFESIENLVINPKYIKSILAIDKSKNLSFCIAENSIYMPYKYILLQCVLR